MIKLKDCILSLTEFSPKQYHSVIYCKFNMPVLIGDVKAFKGSTIEYYHQLYTVVGVETYALPDDAFCRDCNFLVKLKDEKLVSAESQILNTIR